MGRASIEEADSAFFLPWPDRALLRADSDLALSSLETELASEEAAAAF